MIAKKNKKFPGFGDNTGAYKRKRELAYYERSFENQFKSIYSEAPAAVTGNKVTIQESSNIVRN